MKSTTPIPFFLAICALFSAAWGQSEWTVPHRDRDVVIDGFLREWEGVPELTLQPGAARVRNSGDFEGGAQDLAIVIQALWDEEALYVAVQWTDDAWDVEEVRRRDAVYITSDRKRRDRMLFFDNLSLQIRELEFDYLLWFAPRIDDRGPFHWQRRLTGIRKRESATPAPVITPRQDGDRATLELQFKWKDLELEPKKILKAGLPVRWFAADSDSPGALLDTKLDRLKSLEWNGRMRLLPKR